MTFSRYFPKLDLQLKNCRLLSKTLMSLLENTRHVHKIFFFFNFDKILINIKPLVNSTVFSIRKKHVKVLFLIWSSSLVTLSSQANKFYNLHAIYKHFIHFLQLLTLLAKYIRSNTKSKKGCENTQHTRTLSIHTLQTSLFRK